MVRLEKVFRRILLKSNKSNSLSAGNRAAEERRAEMGQKVQVDEHEGGVRSPVLRRLAQSVCHAGSREGQSLPVRGLRRRPHLYTNVSSRFLPPSLMKV